MKIRNLVLPAGIALALVVGACASKESSPWGDSVGMDKNAKSESCCGEKDKADCAAAMSHCNGSKASCEKAKAECEAAKAAEGAKKTDS